MERDRIIVCGEVILIDELDYEFIIALGLSIAKRSHLKYVVINNMPYHGKLLHRILLKIGDPKIIVDHRNGNGLDNRRRNLRVTTQQFNLVNKQVNKNKKSGLPKGVFRKRDKFRAVISWHNTSYSLGSFDTPEQAEAAYKAKAEEWYGEFAYHRSRGAVI